MRCNEHSIIYFDNAATSRPKPDVVIDAFIRYVTDVGVSPGRGAYELAINASRMLYQCRKTVANYFGCQKKDNVIFTKNSTEAINVFLHAFLQQGDHVLISPYEHNAVLRPIHHMSEEGIIEYTILPTEVIDQPTTSLYKYIRKNTKLLAVTLASNLTGRIVFSRELAHTAHKYGLQVLLDASQGAGYIRVDMSQDEVDHLAFTGHKDLLGLPGVGGLCSNTAFGVKPLLQGGTGIHGESFVNPEIFPDAYEAGTLNMPAIWALKKAIEYLDANRTEIISKEDDLLRYLIERLTEVKKVILYEPGVRRVPTLCFNIEGVDSNRVIALLDECGICSRGGVHCAILAHRTIGTEYKGAVRVSINHFNTRSEIDYFIQVLRRL